MFKKECIVMLLAGGQGSRLGVLTKNLAKPAIPFGGKYRIIDFTLSNCINSGIDTVGVLTQYLPLELNAYIGNGQPWDLDRIHGGVSLLPPYTTGKQGKWYKGTANAIYQNIHFIERFEAEYLLVLSGDHIYKMDYSKMLDYHKSNYADATIAVIEVPNEETNRFGIMNTLPTGEVYEFEEKPKKAKSNNASMGVYIFNWQILKKYLTEDDADIASANDFGKNIIPKMLKGGQRMFAYKYEGYWKDVGTIKSYWESNMDLLKSPSSLQLQDASWRIYSPSPVAPPHFTASCATIRQSMITEGCVIYGQVEKSIISSGVHIGKNSVVRSSIIMPNAHIGDNVVIDHAIISEKAVIKDGCIIGGNPNELMELAPNSLTEGLTVVGSHARIKSGASIAGREVG